MLVELRVGDFIRYSLAFSAMRGYLITLDKLDGYIYTCDKLCRTADFRRSLTKDSFYVELDSYFTKEVLCNLLEKLEDGMKLLRIVRRFDVAKGSDSEDLELWEEFENALDGIIDYMPSK